MERNVMLSRVRVVLLAGACVAGGIAMMPSSEANAAAPPSCAALGAKLQGGAITYANSQLVLANTAPAAQGSNFTGTPPSTAKATVTYCLVVESISEQKGENITIYVGLPASPADGGSGQLVGNWNGRTEGLGGGGCSGNLSVTAAVNAFYVGSGTDGGHGANNPNSPLEEGPGNTVPLDDPGNTCEPGVVQINGKNILNTVYINDWVHDALRHEIKQSKSIATLYYGKKPVYNYWNGCSTGGHQGMALAQDIPEELDGILAESPAMYWTRFQTAQMWGEIAMFDLVQQAPVGTTPVGITGAKFAAAQKAAIAACDAADGATDGIIDDPRTCTFDAAANVCGQPNAPAAPACLTTQEAQAIDLIWDGPRNDAGNKIWFGLDRGSDFGILNAAVPFALGAVTIGWDLIDPSYYLNNKWENVALNSATLPHVTGAIQTFSQVFQAGSRAVSDISDTFSHLDTLKAAGTKMITFVGGNDQFIYPRGVLNYYREQAQRYKLANDVNGFEGIQKFYRLFRVPGTGHCGLSNFLTSGGNQVGPWPTQGADFAALVDWVENGVAPSQVLGTGIGPSNVALTRPTCPYPQTAIWNKAGNMFEAANWFCGGNLEKGIGLNGKSVGCNDVLVEYKHEVNGPLDFAHSGMLAQEASCK
jgi:hypothetical protein